MKLLLSACAIFFYFSAFCQNSVIDSIARLQAKNALEVYDQYNKDDEPVYNGDEYLYYTFRMDGDPFFLSPFFDYGWVSYNGRKYDSIKMIYDVVRNQLVALSPDKLNRIVMHNEFIDSFFLRRHTFNKLQEDHKQNLYNSGFFDILYNGENIQFLELRSKVRNPRIIGNVLITSFIEKNRFYIHKNGLYYLVSGKKDVFRVFSDKVHDLKKQMRQNHVKLKRKNFEFAAPKVAAIYDQLTH
ncbi:MAG: hypothetical protein ACTHNG_10560 [Ginsengibacter sp.]